MPSNQERKLVRKLTQYGGELEPDWRLRLKEIGISADSLIRHGKCFIPEQNKSGSKDSSDIIVTVTYHPGGIPGECHRNAGRFVLTNSDYHVFSGFVLTWKPETFELDDIRKRVRWVVHSWAVNASELAEPSPIPKGSNLCYYGLGIHRFTTGYKTL